MSLSLPGMLKDMRLKPNCSGGPQCVPPRIWNLGSSQCPPRPPWPHTLRGPAYRGGWQPCVRKPQGRSLWWDDTHPQVGIVVHLDLVLKESFCRHGTFYVERSRRYPDILASNSSHHSVSCFCIQLLWVNVLSVSGDLPWLARKPTSRLAGII